MKKVCPILRAGIFGKNYRNQNEIDLAIKATFCIESACIM